MVDALTEEEFEKLLKWIDSEPPPELEKGG